MDIVNLHMFDLLLKVSVQRKQNTDTPFNNWQTVSADRGMYVYKILLFKLFPSSAFLLNEFTLNVMLKKKCSIGIQPTLGKIETAEGHASKGRKNKEGRNL